MSSRVELKWNTALHDGDVLNIPGVKVKVTRDVATNIVQDVWTESRTIRQLIHADLKV